MQAQICFKVGFLVFFQHLVKVFSKMKINSFSYSTRSRVQEEGSVSVEGRFTSKTPVARQPKK